MKKDLLTLLGCSSSIALFLLAVPAVDANPVPVQEYVFTSAGEGTEILAVEQSPENLIVDASGVADCGCENTNFTDAEGDLAIANYGCDCAGCRFMVRDLMARQSL